MHLESVQPECLDWKAIDYNFLDRYIYLSGGWEVIKTNMATKYLNEFISAFSFITDIVDIDHASPCFLSLMS